jgi:hypothetical protein
MSDFFDDLLLDVYDVTPVGPATQACVSVMRGTPAAGGGGNLEEVGLGDYEVKRQAVVLDLLTGDAAEDNPKVGSSNKGNECQLYYLEHPVGAKVCGCVVGMKNGIERFCLSPLEDGKNSCSIKTHANKPKATTAPAYAWYVTTTLRGSGGGPAAVRHKFIWRSEVHPLFGVILDEDERKPQAWGALFAKARLAQAIGEGDTASKTDG